MTYMKKIILLSTALFLLSFSGARACEPVEPLGLENTVKYADLIFVGQSIKEGPRGEREFPFSGGPEWVDIRVGDSIKGDLENGQIIRVSTNSPCGYGFSVPFLKTDSLMFLDRQEHSIYKYQRVDEQSDIINGTGETSIVLKDGSFYYATQNAQGDFSQNKMSLTEFKNKYGFTKPIKKSDSLIEGRMYTVKELNTNTLTTSRKFFTEAYVVYASKTLPCPIGKEAVCAPPAPPYIIISDENIPSNLVRAGQDIGLRTDNYGEDYFKVGKKYRFEISVQNTSYANVTKNEFKLVSVKNVDGSDVTVQSPPSTPPNLPAKQSIFIRFVNWFFNLFW